MRYSGQGHEIPVEVPWRPFDKNSGALLQKRFDDAYRHAFGRNVGEIAQGEIVSWSIRFRLHAKPTSRGPRLMPTRRRQGNGTHLIEIAGK